MSRLDHLTVFTAPAWKRVTITTKRVGLANSTSHQHVDGTMKIEGTLTETFDTFPGGERRRRMIDIVPQLDGIDEMWITDGPLIEMPAESDRQIDR